MPLPEIKTRQRKNQPVMNTAQQQMQRNFVRSKAEQAAQKQNEQSESPNSYAEEKISRTAENAVRDGSSLAVREIGSLHQRNDEKYDVSQELDMPEEHQEAPTNTPVVPASESTRCRPTAQQESSEVYSANPVRTRSYEDTAEAVKELTNSSQQEAGRKAAVESIIRQQQANATGGVPESSDALSHRTGQKPIRTREQSIAVPAQTAQQEAARKAAVQNIVRQRQTQKQEKLQIEQAHFSQQVEASKRNSSTIPLPDSQAVFKPMDQTRSSTVGTAKVDGFHNTVSLDKGTASKGQIPIKRNPICRFVPNRALSPLRPLNGHLKELWIPPQRKPFRKRKRPPSQLPKRAATQPPPLGAGRWWPQRKPQSWQQSWPGLRQRQQRLYTQPLLPVELLPFW